MIKKMSMYAMCCVGITLFASEKKIKDIYTWQELQTEVVRAREEYKKNKQMLSKDWMVKGNRINHEPIMQMNINSDQQKK